VSAEVLETYSSAEPGFYTREPFWAVLELMGHIRLVGEVSEVEMFGGKMGRIVKLEEQGGKEYFFGPSSVYGMTRLDSREAALKEAGLTKSLHESPIEAVDISAPGSLVKAIEEAVVRKSQEELEEARLSQIKRTEEFCGRLQKFLGIAVKPEQCTWADYEPRVLIDGVEFTISESYSYGSESIGFYVKGVGRKTAQGAFYYLWQIPLELFTPPTVLAETTVDNHDPFPDE
jgi:hypothetical protein